MYDLKLGVTISPPFFFPPNGFTMTTTFRTCRTAWRFGPVCALTSGWVLREPGIKSLGDDRVRICWHACMYELYCTTA